MDTLEALLSRESVSARYLMEPAPSAEHRRQAYEAAMRAPDHGAIRPWRIMEFEGAGLERLSDVYYEAAKRAEPNSDPAVWETAKAKALRSPLLLGITAVVREDHPKVPVIEQVVAAGCAAQVLLTAFHAQGYGAVMVTGARAYDPYVKQALGLEDKDHIVGFIHLGTPQTDRPPAGKSRPVVEDHVTSWGL
ncbi:MAG: nitroreductase family protein [Rhodospirillales bacterium]